MKLVKLTSSISIFGFLVTNANSSLAATFTLPVNLTINSDTGTEQATASLIFDSNCNCSGTVNFSITKTAPKSISPMKKILWMFKMASPINKSGQPSSNSLLGRAGGNLSGSMFMGSELTTTFQITNTEANITIFEDNLDPLPNLTFPYQMDITETFTGNGAGAAIGQGSYSVNGQLISDYTVNYSFDGAPTATLDNPFTRTVSKQISQSPTDPNELNFSGKVGGTATCPEPSSLLGLLALGGLSASSVMRRKVKQQKLEQNQAIEVA